MEFQDIFHQDQLLFNIMLRWFERRNYSISFHTPHEYG